MMKRHAFIAMPLGVKTTPDGTRVDFDRIFAELIRPALEQSGCTVFRADEETRAGDIRTDMFQELLIADLVVADLTLDNPDVWYELGVRHALRARGVVLIQGPRLTQPFDIYTDRKLHYTLKDGAPDPAMLAAEIARLSAMARDTLNAGSGGRVSPVYTLLPHLREPQWRQLLMSRDNEFSRAYSLWRSRLEIACQKNRPGDILVLAEETPTRALALEARHAAGESLTRLRQFDFALEQFDAALAIDDQDRPAALQRALCLARLRRFKEAREATRWLEMRYPGDPAISTLSGRIEMQCWIDSWRDAGGSGPGSSAHADCSSLQWRAAAAQQAAALRQAIDPFRVAFTLDPSNFYAGVHWLTLDALHVHLTGQAHADIDPLLGGVHWSCLSAQGRDPCDYSARASHALMCLLCFNQAEVNEAWSKAVAVAQCDWFALDASRRTLTMLRDLDFRPTETAAALAIVEREISRSAPPFEPDQVLLFSGHRVDAPERPISRFPMKKVPEAAAHIAKTLDRMGAGPRDLALCQGAAGADLLFLQACLERGVRCQLMLPCLEPEFVESSLLSVAGGEAWYQQYYTLKPALIDSPRMMPTELGPPPEGTNAYERCNLWMLHTALAWGVERVRFICLWNGSAGDGPGGTGHMYSEVMRRTGRVTWIDVRSL